MQLADDALDELWALYDRTGIRPEYMLPMLHLESTFDPTADNGRYIGLAQDEAQRLSSMGIAREQYKSWSAAEQLRAVVAPRLAALAPLGSATRVYQANFLPGSLKGARSLRAALVWKGSPEYAANLFDKSHKGAILVGDLARAMRVQLAEPEVRAAIARAYAMRPSETTDRDPAFGSDFTASTWGPVAVLAAAAVVAARAAGRGNGWSGR